MSSLNGLEIDFGFGLAEGGSTASSDNRNVGSASAGTAGLASDHGKSSCTGESTSTAGDFLGLSSVLDASPPASTIDSAQSAGNAWQKKSLFDQQLRQQYCEHNSLNALMSQQQQQQQPSQDKTMPASSPNATPNPFAAFGGTAPRVQDDLEGSLHAFASQQQQPPLHQHMGGEASSSTGKGNFMFVATIVDPNKVDATPQQMLFLPGSNQVIPMPLPTATASSSGSVITSSSTVLGSQGPAMSSLANLPVVFPASSQSNINAQHQQLMGLSSLQDSFSATYDAQRLSSLPAESWAQGFSVVRTVPDQLQRNWMTAPSLQLQQVPQASQAASMKVTETRTVGVAMPIRPLSAYNFFFSDERERILQNKTTDSAHDESYDNSKKQRLLLQHMAKDRTKRRPHRKTHGKINFTTLSKLIGQRWRSLPEVRKNFYREVAAVDLERYQRELRERSPASLPNVC